MTDDELTDYGDKDMNPTCPAPVATRFGPPLAKPMDSLASNIPQLLAALAQPKEKGWPRSLAALVTNQQTKNTTQSRRRSTLSSLLLSFLSGPLFVFRSLSRDHRLPNARAPAVVTGVAAGAGAGASGRESRVR